jgi:hypothetical protein
MLFVVIDKASPTLIGVPFGLPLKFVVLTVVKVPIGTKMLVKVATPVLVIFHVLPVPCASKPVPRLLMVIPLTAAFGLSVIERPVMSPAPVTTKLAAVLLKLPACTLPVTISVEVLPHIQTLISKMYLHTIP